MSTTELKRRLIDEIQKTKNEDLLEEIYEQTKSQIIILTICDTTRS